MILVRISLEIVPGEYLNQKLKEIILQATMKESWMIHNFKKYEDLLSLLQEGKIFFLAFGNQFKNKNTTIHSKVLKID